MLMLSMVPMAICLQPAYAYGYYGLPGVAAHPTGTSFEARSPQGLSLFRGKRDADADAFYAPYGYGYYGLAGVAGHPAGTSYTARSVQGLRGKRTADAEPEADADAYYGGIYGGFGYPLAYRGYGYGTGALTPP